jgi:hypothetical protein
MRRKLFTLAAGVSAVLCLASAVGWADSYRNARMVFWNSGHPRGSAETSTVAATSVRGITHFSRLRLPVAPRSPVRPHEFQLGTHPVGSVIISPDRWSRAGFQYQSVRRPDRAGHIFSAPYWFWLVAGAVLPSWWIIRYRRVRRRRAAGCCPACGYDLRATPDRCPECGAVPAAKGEQA